MFSFYLWCSLNFALLAFLQSYYFMTLFVYDAYADLFRVVPERYAVDWKKSPFYLIPVFLTVI